MTLAIRDQANTSRVVTEPIIRDAGNTPRTISELWVRDPNNVSRLVYATAAAIAAGASPTFVLGYTAGTGTAVSDSTTVTPIGGIGPYTYAWSVTTYDAATPPSPTSPTSATTTFIQTGISLGAYHAAVFTCTVTDSLGATAMASVDATFVDIS